MGNLAKEGVRRTNIAGTLFKLKRYDEARTEIMRAIECKQNLGHAGTVWTAFNILGQIEEAAGNHVAARTAWVQAWDAYLAYRRQGGYANQGDANLVEHVLGLIAQQKVEEIEPLFNRLASDPNTPDTRKAIMQAIMAV